MFELFAFISINLLGAMSPGADFAIVSYYSLKGARQAALFAVLGIATALLIHVFYCAIGVAWFLQNSPSLFFWIQLLGACYLGYLGLMMFQPPKEAFSVLDVKISNRKAFISGFFTNLINPKAILFLFSLFTQFVTPETSFGMKVAFGISVPLVAISWFSLLAFLITHPSFLPYLQRYRLIFSRAMGVLLLFLTGSVLYFAFRSLALN